MQFQKKSKRNDSCAIQIAPFVRERLTSCEQTESKVPKRRILLPVWESELFHSGLSSCAPWCESYREQQTANKKSTIMTRIASEWRQTMGGRRRWKNGKSMRPRRLATMQRACGQFGDKRLGTASNSTLIHFLAAWRRSYELT